MLGGFLRLGLGLLGRRGSWTDDGLEAEGGVRAPQVKLLVAWGREKYM